jgi:hypothetical protein
MTAPLVTSSLESVTVFREGAIGLRKARVAPSGATEIRVGGLPLSLEPGSVRAWVSAGSVRVFGVRADFDVALVAALDVPAEKQALETAKDTLARLQAMDGRLEKEIAELTDLRPRFLEQRRGDPPREAKVPACLAMTDFVQDELGRRLEIRRALGVEMQEAERELGLRERRLQESSSALGMDRVQLGRVAVVTLSEAPTAEIELFVEYHVPGARWVPTYQLKLDRGLGSGALLLRASVAQNTGEDWTDVRLALSTANLEQHQDLPELQSLRMGRAQFAPPLSGWREPPPGLDDLFAGHDAIAHGTRPPVRRRAAPAAGARAAGGPPAAAPVGVAAAPPGVMRMSMAMPPAPMAPAPMLMASKSVETSAIARRSVAPMSMAPEEPSEAASEAALEPPPPPPPLVPGDALLDYANLVMPGPGDPLRGRLHVRVFEQVVYLAGIEVEFEQVCGLMGEAQARARRLPDAPAGTRPVDAVEAFDYRYDCATRTTVPSTNAWTNLAVMDCQVEISPEYLCVPSVETKVYRTLRLRNLSSHALLPGPVDVSMGGEFLLTTRLPTLSPNAKGTQPLGLGVEEAIKVRREIHFQETSGGLLGGTTLLQHQVEIEIHNHLSTPAGLEVRERVPWIDSDHEKTVKLEETQVQPDWESVDKPLDGETVVHGARRWRVTVAPGEKRSLTAEYTLRIPSDRLVLGGNRRA